MNITTLLDMAASGAPDRIALGTKSAGITYAELQRRAQVGARFLIDAECPRVVFLAGNDDLFPTTLFSCAGAGIPIVPLNFRLSTEQLETLAQQQPAGTWIVRSEDCPDLSTPSNGLSLTTDQWRQKLAESSDTSPLAFEPTDDIAVLLYTSGTSAAPKAAVLRHRHLSSYILGAVEFGSADEDDATLVTVPPYHIAGVANALSNIYAGRRIVYLDRFSPADWINLAATESVTNAMLVPTMLARIVEHIDTARIPAPGLRSLAYGGARMPAPVVERALELFPNTDFVNAYGLTETSSTIAVLGPADHRAAMESNDPVISGRLASAGRLVPGLETQIRDESGAVLEKNQVGELWVRGPQVSGEYVGLGSATDADGWFPTKDLALIDDEDYLFVHGRIDDTIIRGGENIAPAEIEDVILRHPAISECAVVGIPDDEWGQRLAAVVVLGNLMQVSADDLRSWIVPKLRSSKTPDEVHIWTELPQTATGKILRRKVLEQLAERF
jgi:acyl-CoA synthetase (AMP-forming)/AMP-acid ligase II